MGGGALVLGGRAAGGDGEGGRVEASARATVDGLRLRAISGRWASWGGRGGCLSPANQSERRPLLARPRPPTPARKLLAHTGHSPHKLPAAKLDGPGGASRSLNYVNKTIRTAAGEDG